MTDHGDEPVGDVSPPPEGSAGRRILDTIADGVYVFDADWTLVYANAAALAASPFDREDLVGESLGDIQAFAMGEPPAPADLEAYKRAFETGRREHARTMASFEGTDGQQPFSVRTRRLETDDGAFAGAVVTLRDETARVEAETALRRQNERLEEFANLVSHDLRNPLNVAKGTLDGLETDDQAALDRVHEALDRMDAIIGDVLALARADESVDDRAPVSLDSAAREAWASLDTAGADLIVAADRTVEAHRGHLDRALENLLQNAVQHGGEDVTVRVGPLPDGFYVADDGPGVPVEDRNRVFDSGYSTADQGTGFGLDLVRRAVEAHGWTLSVTDSTEGGARFEVTGLDGSPD